MHKYLYNRSVDDRNWLQSFNCFKAICNRLSTIDVSVDGVVSTVEGEEKVYVIYFILLQFRSAL
nr:MAG TPA: hypothetical protein [Caudoviricetes sp.]